MNEPTKQRLGELLGALREGTLGDEQVAELESILADEPQAIDYYLDYTHLCAELRHYHGTSGTASVFHAAQAAPEQGPSTPPRKRRMWPYVTGSAVAAGIAVAATILLFFGTATQTETLPTYPDENGVAVLTRSAGAEWEAGRSPEVGETLHRGKVRLTSGLAQIEFFKGAIVILEGPAEFELVSDQKGVLHRGTLRSYVPEPAQGFVIETPDNTVIDHGTEFGLSVGEAGASEVHVFDGEVEVQGTFNQRLKTGQGVRLARNKDPEAIAANIAAFSGPEQLSSGVNAEVLRRRNLWAAHAAKLAADPSALLYYTFESPDAWGRTLKDESHDPHNGAIVGSEWAEGRWPGKGALEFKRTSDRVRVDIPGKHDAITLVAWIRFDGFDRWLSSPLLTDTWHDGQLHWHVSWDGEIILGVGGQGNYTSPQNLIGAADLGRWAFLATVVDPETETVTHYLDGKQVYRKKLKKTRKWWFGPSGIGNWSRHGVWRDNDIRSLNGRMDEFGIFARAFTPTEIQQMYETGRPL